MTGATASSKNRGQRKIAAASGCVADTLVVLSVHNAQAPFRPSSRSLTQTNVGRRETCSESVILMPKVIEVRIVDTEAGSAEWKKAL